MDQAKPSRPAAQLSPASVRVDAENERWLSEARRFATPGQPGFVQALDSLRPGPLLVAVLEVSTSDPSRYSGAELGALIRACERLRVYCRLVELVMIGELARRRLAA
jgi:hypothetical protein